MNTNRRNFLQTSTLAGAGLLILNAAAQSRKKSSTLEELEQAGTAPVLDVSSLKDPIIIKSIDILKSGNDFVVRTESKDGAVGYSITNSRANYLYPFLQQKVAPYFIGKDARDLEHHIDEVYLYGSNYKFYGLTLWNCVAWIEFSLLDMMGKIADKHISAFFGGKIRDEVPMYIASGNRHTTPKEEAQILKRLVEEHELKAVKFKVGGRMRNNRDSIPGRSEALIPLAREVLGDEITIHADSNGSYDAEHAIPIGKLLQDIDAHFFEEPCPFDHYTETKKVADALEIPIAGGEQETSHRRFRNMIHNQTLQIVQPDMHYNGGFIRASRVARMAALAGMPVTPHMSGGGTGFVEVLNFCSFTPNIGAYHEYKKGFETRGEWYDPPLRKKDGKISVPQGPGLGHSHELEIFKNAKPIA